MSTSREELLACPFCGGTDLSVDSGDVQPDNWWTGHVRCDDCDAEGGKPTEWLGSKEEAEEEARKVWNYRLAATPKAGVDREVIALGDIVQVNERMPHYGEWARAELKVVGLHLAPDGTVWADVIEGDQRHRGNGIYDGETTDIDTRWLSKIGPDAILALPSVLGGVDQPVWQPIETAPKDGTWVLVNDTRHSGSTSMARWDDCRYATKPRPYWSFVDERVFGVSTSRSNQPTCWMPLPAPPAQTDNAGLVSGGGK